MTFSFEAGLKIKLTAVPEIYLSILALKYNNNIFEFHE